ncbi:spermatogenesis-associated serine-rich protein 2 [Bombina bombina]|uniref:spermatogenesis-associated serine-rich protein 2 n=1 Tax=Bombina bombina TaxID=8345 RepID=UPI00235B1563|nr:spermatogenesis-associated serine-rich protein 2 [Bombina bombina]
MSRKHNHKDSIGFVFDIQSNTVMAQGGSYENMKEKINAVRAVVPNKSNNEIILVLQHFDNCVDRTVQAFMEGYAVEVLKEWTVLGKKKNKKKRSKPKSENPVQNSTTEDGKVASGEGEQSAASFEKGGLNGYHINGSTNDTESVDSLSECLETISIDARELEDSELSTPDVANPQASTFQNGRPDLDLKLSTSNIPHSSYHQKGVSDHRHSNKVRSGSISSNVSLNSSVAEDASLSAASKKLGANIEKSVKDLQRCSVSLARYRMVVKEEMDISIKKMKQTFSELQSWEEKSFLDGSESNKALGIVIADSKFSGSDSEDDEGDLGCVSDNLDTARVEVSMDFKKLFTEGHFVSERKYDEELGRVARFTADLETLKKSMETFGQVSHPKNNYSARSRCYSLASPCEDTPAPSTLEPSSASSLTSTNRKPTPTGDSSTSTSHYSNRQNQPPRQGYPMNRRPGQGFRSQGPPQNYNVNNARYDYAKRNRNNSWYQSNSRNQSYPNPRQSTDRNPVHPSGTNGSAASTESVQTGSSSPENKALPQRKPRANHVSSS